MAEGHGLVLTAHEGETNEGEEDRHTQHNDTIHPKILQLLTGTSKRERQCCRQLPHLAVRRPKQRDAA
jgi:hypothetical protein